MPWLYLIIAIAGEIIGTTALKASDGFTRLTPSLVAITGYAVGFYFLAIVLRTIPLGITYAIWRGPRSRAGRWRRRGWPRGFWCWPSGRRYERASS